MVGSERKEKEWATAGGGREKGERQWRRGKKRTNVRLQNKPLPLFIYSKLHQERTEFWWVGKRIDRQFQTLFLLDHRSTPCRNSKNETDVTELRWWMACVIIRDSREDSAFSGMNMPIAFDRGRFSQTRIISKASKLVKKTFGILIRNSCGIFRCSFVEQTWGKRHRTWSMAAFILFSSRVFVLTLFSFSSWVIAQENCLRGQVCHEFTLITIVWFISRRVLLTLQISHLNSSCSSFFHYKPSTSNLQQDGKRLRQPLQESFRQERDAHPDGRSRCRRWITPTAVNE